MAAGPLVVLLAACGGAPPPCALSTHCPAPLACDRGRCTDPSVQAPPDEIAARRLRLPAADDAVVLRGDDGRAPLGPTDFLVVGGSGAGPAWRSFLRFDLEPLGPSPRVVRADLVLEARDDPPGLRRGSITVFVHRAARPWSGGSLTWTGQPGRAGAEASSARVPTARRVRLRIDATALVRAWIRAVHPNHGLVLSARHEDDDHRVVLHSSRATDASLRPTLEVWVRRGATP